MIGSLSPGTSITPGSSGSVSADVYNKVANVMASQNHAAPKINAALAADRIKLSAIGQVRSALDTFGDAVEPLTGQGSRLAASSSSPGVVATASSRAAPGIHAVEVSQLAQGQVLRSKPLAGANAAIGNGSAVRLRIEFGTISGTQFTPEKGGRKTIALPEGATLQDVADAINGANAGLSARLAGESGKTVLEIASPTGAASSVRIGVDGDPAASELLSFDPAKSGGLTQTAAAHDALLTIDGTVVKRAANTIVDAIPGTTLTLAATGSASVTVAEGPAQLAENVATLVEAYNALNAKLTTLAQGELKGDTTLARIRSQIARILTADGAGARLGISMQKNGELSLNQDALRRAVAADPVAAAKLVSGEGAGIADQFVAKLKQLFDARGTLARETESLGERIEYLDDQRDALEKALTIRAQTLLKAYSAQEAYGRGGLGGSLLDYL